MPEIMICRWDYCTARIPKYMNYCPEHRDMKWWERYTRHIKHQCWEEEEIDLDEFEDCLDIIHECRSAGGPEKAARLLQREHGVDPTILDDRFEGQLVGT